MSHFLAVSLRTGELPHLSAGTGTSSGGRGVLLPVLPVSQGPGEAEWGLSWVAVLLRWGNVMSRSLGKKLSGGDVQEASG